MISRRQEPGRRPPRRALTPRGTGLVVSAVLLAAAGWLFGIEEFFALAAAAVLVVAVAAAWTATASLQLSTRRQLLAPRSEAGHGIVVLLTVRNTGRRRTPVIEVVDPNPGSADTHLAIGGLAPGEVARGTYVVATPKRGLFTIGPLSASVRDPLRLARRTVVVGAPASLIVHPRPEATRLPLVAAGSGRAERATTPAAGRDNDEFSRLRAYEPGDDLRRVHWPSTARTGTLVVREDELDHAGHITVVVDLRRSRWTTAALERALAVAAGLTDAAHDADIPVRLLVTSGIDTGVGTGDRHRLRIFDELAGIGAGTGDRRRRGASERRRPDHPAAAGLLDGGTAIVVSADSAAADDLRRGLRGRQRAQVHAVVVDPSGAEREGGRR